VGRRGGQPATSRQSYGMACADLLLLLLNFLFYFREDLFIQVQIP
jgi:hypothetical protein